MRAEWKDSGELFPVAWRARIDGKDLGSGARKLTSGVVR
jgi:hypothetical protein